MSKRYLEDDNLHSSKRLQSNRMDSFRVLPSQHYSRGFPDYKQPVEVNSYSIDGKRQVWFDDRELKYYAKPRLTPNTPSLSYNYDRYIQRDDSIPEHIDTLLDAITDAKSKTPNEPINADIITWRGIITKIFCTPFSRNEPWELRATKYKGAIYIEEQQTVKKRNQEAHMNERQRLMSYWGYQFEAMCTTDEPNGKAPEVNQDLEAPNTNIQYCVVVRTKLGKNSIVMGAEVDCIEGPKPEEKSPLKQYIELKTSRRIDVDRQLITFEKFKLLKFWAQSFLVGVPRVICGFRDDDGNVSHLETLNTLEIPRRVRGKPNMWDPSVCMNFANQFLDWLKSVVTIDDPTVTYSIVWKEPWREIHVEYNGRKDTFLTQRYLDGQHHNLSPRIITQRGVFLLMAENKELQEEEYMALEAIYGPDVVKKDETSPDAYIVTINLDEDDETLRSPRILVLRFFLPPTYPSNDPPVYEISSKYCGTHRVDAHLLEAIDNEFQTIFQQGEVVLFEWISWLRDYLESEIDKPDEDTLCQQLELQKLEDSPKEEVKDNVKEIRQSLVVAPPIYTSPEPLVDRKSVFKAHVAEVHSADEVRAVVAKLLEDKKIAKATHNIMAYRIILKDGKLLQDNDDDGETAAGGRLLHMMQITDVQNVVVVVSRWFGGILLGADRFKDINNCARTALEDCGYIAPTDKSSKNKRKK